MTSDKLKSLFADSPTRPAGYRQTQLINGEEFGFRWIPPGEFDMGSPKSEMERWANERLHHVTLTKGFWLLETPVTRRLYQSVVGTKPSWFRFSGSLATCLVSKFDELDSFDELLTHSIEMVRSDLPVESVNYDGAMEFCRKLTKFMPNGLKAYIPTEAQWEYACRTGTTTAYWYGNTVDKRKMNCFDSGIGQPTPVKTYDLNPWGLYDMHGNVCEWIQDLYEEDYPAGTVVDPKNLNSGLIRVCRGGSWSRSVGNCRSAFWSLNASGSRGDFIGFRFLLVCD